MKQTVLIFYTLISLVLLLPVIAQNDDVPRPSTDGTFATIDLESQFLLDPYLIRVLGGGSTPATDFRSDCAGFVDTEPNAILNWSGETDQLNIFVYSDVDPVLVVRTPNGDIICNDDVQEIVFDPAVQLENPQDGSYEIYVGTLNPTGYVIGFLVFTELDVEYPLLDLSPLLEREELPIERGEPTQSMTALNLDAPASFGSDVLNPGFGTLSLAASGGGGLPAFDIQFDAIGCTGFITSDPSYSFTLANDLENIRVFFEAPEDSTLVLVLPDGRVVCNDDADSGITLNPMVDIVSPTAGDYDVYIGSYSATVDAPGVLTVTDDTSLMPEEVTEN